MVHDVAVEKLLKQKRSHSQSLKKKKTEVFERSELLVSMMDRYVHKNKANFCTLASYCFSHLADHTLSRPREIGPYV